MNRQMISKVTFSASTPKLSDRANQQQIELIDEPAAETVAKLTLAGGADEQAENGGATDGRDFGSRFELGTKHEWNERAEHHEIDNIEEVSGGD